MRTINAILAIRWVWSLQTIFAIHTLVAKEVCDQADWLPEDDELVILDESTIEKPWGWVFFHTSRKWLETKDFRYALAGKAPTLVERSTGKLIATGIAFKHRILH